MPEFWSISEIAVALYFSSFGVTNWGISNLLQHRLNTTRSDGAVDRKLSNIKRDNDLCWEGTKELEPCKVGYYLSRIMADAELLEELTFFGRGDDELVDMVGPHSTHCAHSRLTFIGSRVLHHLT